VRRAPKTKGRGWDVFETSEAASAVHAPVEIQRIDDPHDGKEPLLPAFEDDFEAVRHVVWAAHRGDKEAIAALWEADQDPLVHYVLWGVKPPRA